MVAGKTESKIDIKPELTNSSKLVSTAILYDGESGGLKREVVSLPSLGGKRRVHNDGIMMLDNHYIMKETE